MIAWAKLGTRRIFWMGLALASGLVGAGTLVFASVPHTFAAGETLTADNLNTTFAALDQRIAGREALSTTASGQLAASDVKTQTVSLAPNATYLVSAILFGAYTDVHQTYVVHSPGNGNLNVSFAPLLSNSYSLGAIQFKTQDGGAGYAGNAASNNTLSIVFTAGTQAASWSYSATRLQ